MPLYVGDYIADTRHLTTMEHGAYLLLLMCMWRANGSLPNTEGHLSRCANLPLDKWRRIAPTILAFFTIKGEKITHKRVTKEIARCENTISARRVAGALGNQAKALKRNKPYLATANGVRTQPEPEPRDRNLALSELEISISATASPSPAEGQASPSQDLALTPQQIAYLDEIGIAHD